MPPGAQGIMDDLLHSLGAERLLHELTPWSLIIL